MNLLRIRLRTNISNKKTRMAEHSTTETSSSSSSEQNQSPILSAFLGSPRFLGGFLSRTISDEIAVTPTSILDTKQFSNCKNHPFGYEKRSLKSSQPIEKKGIGLVLIHDKEEEIKHSEPTSKMVLFASNLKVQVPPFLSSDNPPNSPGDFGIKTRNSSQLLRSLSINSPRVRGKDEQQQQQQEAERLSVTEMEMSEEYTCVMTHGPNPKTTHIFDDTIVESCCGVGKLTDQKIQQNDGTVLTSLPLDFLGFCYTCKVKLDDGKDIYMFRGEKAFCTDECRFQEMVMEGNEANNSRLHEDEEEEEEDCYHF